MAKQNGSVDHQQCLYFILRKPRGERWTVLQEIELKRIFGDPEKNEGGVSLHYRTKLTREQLDGLLAPKTARLGMYIRVFPEPAVRVSASA